MTVSHHLLRRRARARAKALTAVDSSGHRYVVVKALRGPWRWLVLRETAT